MSHPRDPRLRRTQRDPLAAAVALEVAADAMRAGLRGQEPDPTDIDPEVLEHVRSWDTAAAEPDPAPLHAAVAAGINPAQLLVGVRPELLPAATDALLPHLTHTIADDVPADSLSELLERSDLDPEQRAAVEAHADELLAEAATEQGDEPDVDEHEHVPMMNGRCAVCGEKLEQPDPEPDVDDTLEQPAPAVTPPVPARPWGNDLRAIGRGEESTTPLEVFSSEHPPAVGDREPIAAWRSVHDPRSLSFGASRLLRGSGPLQDVLLPTGPVLDQMLAGSTLEEQSCCTGCGTVAALNVLDPDRVALRPTPAAQLEDAEAIYDRGRQLDEYLGDHTAGSSVLGAMRAAVDLGLIGGYLWCFGTRDIAQTIIQKRLPVVVGVRWSAGMWQTAAGGLVEVTGEQLGLGHCLAIVGLRLKGPNGEPGPFFIWQNSAGESYGEHGLGYVHHRVLADLLRGIGEAAVPTLEKQT